MTNLNVKKFANKLQKLKDEKTDIFNNFIVFVSMFKFFCRIRSRSRMEIRKICVDTAQKILKNRIALRKY